MATKILSPFTAGIRTSNEINLPQEDFRICRGHDDFAERKTSEPIADHEKSHLNTDSTRTTNACAIDSERDKNATMDVLLDTWIKTSTRKRVALPRRFLGIVLAIIASLVLSVTALMVKLAESIPSLEVTFIRLTFLLVFSLPSMIFFKDKFIHPWRHSKYLLLRGASGAAAMTLSIYAVKNMPLADARVIIYTSPVFTAIFGRIFLKESVSKFDVIAMVLSIGEVVLIGRPTFLFGSLGKTSSYERVWMPTLAAVAFSFILTRKMSQEVGTRVVVFHFALVGSMITLLGSLLSGVTYPDCGTRDIIYALAAGVLGFFRGVDCNKGLGHG